MTRIIRFHETGEPDVLKIEDVDVVSPGAGEVRIAVKAIGLNRAESMFRRGQYLETPSFPSRLGYEAAGTVDAVGEGIDQFQVGDVVSTIPSFLQGQYGVYGESAIVPASAVVKHPANLSWEEAAAVWMQYATAYGALIELARVQRDDFVLIPAASSSVGLAAIQICSAEGAKPVALTRGSAKREALLEAGALEVVVTEEQDIVAEVNRITGGGGARVVFDPVGGPTVNQLAAAMAPGGMLLVYGALSPEPTPLPLMDAIGKSLTIRGYILFEITSDLESLERAKRYIVDGLALEKLKPIVARTFPLEQIVEAHRYLESNRQIGKIVVTV